MTFREIELSLPNGFHDSVVKGVHIDFLRRTAAISMELHAAAEGEPDPERYRPGTLTIDTLYFFFAEPPDPTYPFQLTTHGVNADGAPIVPGESTAADSLLSVVPRDATAYRFFLEEWNSFLYLAGRGVNFTWDDMRSGAEQERFGHR